MFDAHETKKALQITVALMCALTVAKTIASVPYLGTFAVTCVAFMQLYIPLKRADSLGVSESVWGLHTQGWVSEIKTVIVLVLAFFPLYTLAYHWTMTEGHVWLVNHGLKSWAVYVPHCVWGPPDFSQLGVWFSGLLWLGERILSHTLGVALPEEVFYRGYLQKVLQHTWPPVSKVFGVPFGRVCVGASVVFALAHFLGEWNPARFGPFFPGLVFAWQANRTGSLLGAIVFHAVCNVYGECLFRCYQFVPS